MFDVVITASNRAAALPEEFAFVGVTTIVTQGEMQRPNFSHRRNHLKATSSHGCIEVHMTMQVEYQGFTRSAQITTNLIAL